MADQNLVLCANKAIRETVEDMRPSAGGSWMILIPATTLTMPGRAEWMDFLGRISIRYNNCASPCSGPEAADFASLQAKQLIVLRDAIVEGTTCP